MVLTSKLLQSGHGMNTDVLGHTHFLISMVKRVNLQEVGPGSTKTKSSLF